MRGGAGEKSFIVSFPQVDYKLGKAFKPGIAKEKENTLYSHTLWLNV